MIFDEFEKLEELLDEYKLTRNKSEIYFIKKNILKLEKKISRQINPNNKENLVIILSTIKEIYDNYFNKNEYDMEEFDYYRAIFLNLKEELEQVN